MTSDRCKGCDPPVTGKGKFCRTCSTVKVHGDYTRKQLTMAFDRVKNADNWKMPIDKTLKLNPAEVEAVRHAVVFYAGCVPTFTAKVGEGYRVQAVGYYMAVGA